jgi:hypothetical protein
VDSNRMHKVLRISPDYAFCLHSKERVPFHIIIEVAYEPMSETEDHLPEEISCKEYEGEDDGESYKSKTKWAVEKIKGLANRRIKSKGKEQIELMDIHAS